MYIFTWYVISMVKYCFYFVIIILYKRNKIVQNINVKYHFQSEKNIIRYLKL